MAETKRSEERAANPYVPDRECGHMMPGWIRSTDEDGDPVMKRCDCWKKWRGIVDESADRKTVAAGA